MTKDRQIGGRHPANPGRVEGYRVVRNVNLIKPDAIHYIDACARACGVANDRVVDDGLGAIYEEDRAFLIRGVSGDHVVHDPGRPPVPQQADGSA